MNSEFAVKTRLFLEVNREIRQFRQRGKILQDYADEGKHRFGFQSWIELFAIIDSEMPDEGRMEAIKAMFFALNRTGATDKERTAAYYLFQTAKQLSTEQISYLRVCYEIHKASAMNREPKIVGTGTWLGTFAMRFGDQIAGLTNANSEALEKLGLLMSRTEPHPAHLNGQLSDRGMRFCRSMELYRSEAEALEREKAS